MWTPLQWERIGGPGKTFAVTGDGQLYGLSPDGSGVWHYKGTPDNWEQAGGPTRMIYCGANLLFATDPQTKHRRRGTTPAGPAIERQEQRAHFRIGALMGRH
jgi:hypothetical protein